MTHTSQLYLALTALRSKLGEPSYIPVGGICYNVTRNCVRNYEATALADELATYFPKWPHYSGEIEYPIGGEYEFYNGRSHRWTGRSRELRLDLINFIINELEQQQ